MDEQISGPSLAVSLSGGGHRATLFDLGALIYLVDAGANKQVTSIASVSGGSLTNGFVGQTLDFRSTDSTSFRTKVAAPLAAQIANRGTLFAPFLTKLYLMALVVGAVLVFTPIRWTSGTWYWRSLAFLFLMTVWGWLFGKRGVVCAHAFQKTLYSPDGRPTPLSRLKKTGLEHVICATELQSAEQVCFSGEFVYTFLLGHGEPDDLPLARAVQASAAFPGGFPPVFLPTARHKFNAAPNLPGGPSRLPKWLVMSDGGVYDNMGDQWARGIRDRLKRWPELGNGRLPPTRLIAVNASARVPWKPFRQAFVPLIGELFALLRVNDVMYINTTNVRRQEIVASFDPNHPNNATALPSALVQISQSPFVVAESFAKGSGDVADRANKVLAMLGETKTQWSKIATENARVSTTLRKLGSDVSARLLYQGYVVAMCNLHVIFGEEFPLCPSEVAFERFSSLVK
jgi:Patatin-like phospholipase